jgi:hypothetical protein
VNADEDVSPAKPKGNSQWVGPWEMSEELNRILGFKDDASRNDAVFDHPSSFRLSLDKVIGEKMNASLLRAYRDTVFRRIDHRIVATGKWETKFDVDPGIDTNCFVTQHDGSTYLWVGAPYVVLFGGKVSFIQGVDRKHDVMVIEFNKTSDRLVRKFRTPDTVAYKRSRK